MGTPKRKWVVRVPVTLVLCCEVVAPNRKAAVIAANEKCSEIEPMYFQGHGQIGQPVLAAPCADCDDNSVYWDQDSFDQCEIFLNEKAEAQLIEGRSE